MNLEISQNDNLFSIDSNQFNYNRRKKNTLSHHLQTNSIISEFLKIENSAERRKKKFLFSKNEQQVVKLKKSLLSNLC